MKERAKELIVSLLTYGNILPFEESLAEVLIIKEDDERLLEHINGLIELLEKAKKEIEDETNNSI